MNERILAALVEWFEAENGEFRCVRTSYCYVHNPREAVLDGYFDLPALAAHIAERLTADRRRPQ